MSGAEMVARLTVVMRTHGGQVVSYALRDTGAWVLVLSANRRATVCHLSSRPTVGTRELVVTAEPFAPAGLCPVALATAAWLIETEPDQVSPAVRQWRRTVAARGTR
jgi:hypothetical protein